MNLRLFMIIMAFAAGVLATSLLDVTGFSTPLYTNGFEFPSSLSKPELEMPLDRIKEDQIHVLRDKIVIDLENAEWSAFTPTKSMVPIIDTGANAIQVKPEPGCHDIEVGDIISYKSEYADGTIIHRVIEKNLDAQGLHFRAKGDNNPNVDPGNIKCEQILRVLVAIIY